MFQVTDNTNANEMYSPVTIQVKELYNFLKIIFLYIDRYIFITII